MKDKYTLIVRLPAEMEFQLKRHALKRQIEKKTGQSVNALIIEAVKAYFKKVRVT